MSVLRIGDLPIGPGEFVWLVAHARAVVTNSFHGTAFAVNHAKPFVSVIPRGMNNASRIESLLKSLGLTDRVVKAPDAASFDLAKEIPFEDVLTRMEALRSDSVAFLKHAIDEPAQKVSHKLPLGCYAVWNADEDVRAKSTSGGLFRVLAESTIAHGGVVYGAAFTPDFHKVVHQSAETIEALDPLMKSKYVWSDPTAAYGQAVQNLKDGREVLFVGTPCQIAAMKSLAKGVDEKLTTVDIICHGTPRPEIFTAYVEELERRFGGKVTRYEFRNKAAGWNFPHVKADFSNTGEWYLRNDPYFLGFGINATLRSGCFRCPYTNLERVADFTVGDCWRVAASHPEWDDNRGTSLVLVNTPKAMRLWGEIMESGRVKGGAYDLDLAQMRNLPLMQKAHKPACYDRFREVFEETGSFGEAAKTFLSFKFVFRATLVYWVKKLGWFYLRHRQ